jgi:hypothetical protein
LIFIVHSFPSLHAKRDYSDSAAPPEFRLSISATINRRADTAPANANAATNWWRFDYASTEVSFDFHNFSL